MRRTKEISLWVMAILYIVAGLNHLINPAFYIAIIPPDLPNPEWLSLLSGLAEIVFGVFLLEPRTRVLAAWGVIALLIAIFPANLHVAIHNVGVPSGEVGAGSGIGNWIRLPFQALLIAWAWWHTQPDGSISTAE